MQSLLTPSTVKSTKLEPIIQLWLLRMLVNLGGQHELFSKRHGFSNDAIAESLGLGHWIDPAPNDFDPKAVRSELRQMCQDAEMAASSVSVSECLRLNVERLAALVGFNQIECRLLEFAVLVHNERHLDDVADWLGQMTSGKVSHVLSGILGLSEKEVRVALSPQGLLASSGVLSVDRLGPGTLRAKLDLISDGFADTMAASETDPVTMLRGTVSAAGPGKLSLKDYAHIQSSIEVMRHYLHYTAQTGKQGVNIFLYGIPGTGKSQLARALAQDVGCELFEVASEDADGDPVNGERRLRALRAAQSVFSKRRPLILFDEVEDVFNDGDLFSGRKSTAQTRKAWVNRVLEENPVPTLWLSNSISGLDPAFIRRFDMVVELPVPSRSRREQALRASCSDVLMPGHIARIADAETLAPAVVERATAVVRSIKEDLGPEKSAAAFEQLINNTLEAQGHRSLAQHDSNRLPEVYAPSFINADADLAQVATGIARAGVGRLCLYGPPGTGKTAYGRWLAQQLDIPLSIKRASDLMSPYVGENEQNIAQAFRRAAKDGALLMIDEVDSFLQDRRGAQRGWEVSMVNEMLTQMESYPGIFIASTNLMAGLDQAALRRFDLKVKFDFLRPGQAWDLLCRYCAQMGLESPQQDLRGRLGRLVSLTPGDFATVLRQHQFRPVSSPLCLVAALEGECTVKGGERAPIGFI